MRMRSLLSLTVGAVVLATAAYAKDPPKNKGNLRYSITVSSFENRAGWHGRWNIGDGFTSIMTDALQASGLFLVLGV